MMDNVAQKLIYAFLGEITTRLSVCRDRTNSDVLLHDTWKEQRISAVKSCSGRIAVAPVLNF
jgi:hypothetical protein